MLKLSTTTLFDKDIKHAEKQRKEKKMKNLSYKEHLIEKLKDPEYAAAYLEACLEESIEADDMGILMLAIRDVVEAHGGMGVISSKMHVNRESFCEYSLS